MNAPVLTPHSPPKYQERLARVTEKEAELKAIVGQLFPGPIEIEIEEDPEIAGRRHLTLCVETRETVQEVLARELRWYELSLDLLGHDCDLVHLDAIILE